MALPAKMKKKLEADIALFLKDKKILIADSSSSCRANISRAICEMGAKTPNLMSIKTFDEAKEQLEKSKPQICIADYYLDKNYGLDLINDQKEFYPDPRERLFILATGTSSESAVAEAAEEDVDAFIIKPFTGSTIKDYLQGAILKKIRPSKYVDAIQKGKDHLDKKSLSDAKSTFDEAKELSKKPALAFYYEAKTEEEGQSLDDAHASFEKGLEYNNIHYKCLTGSFDVLQKMDKKDNAYDRLQTIVDNFPISPQRLGKLFELAVHTRNYTDVAKFHKLFTELERRPEKLVRTVSAGLVVCGKFLLREGKVEEAQAIMDKASTSCARDPVILIQICYKFIEFSLAEKAKKYLGQIHAEDQNSPEYKEVQFCIANESNTALESIEKGRALISQGIKGLDIYKILIKRYMEIEKTKEAEAIVDDGSKVHPNSVGVLAGLLAC